MSVRIPFVMTIADPTDMTATIGTANAITAYRGRRTPFNCTFTDGGPAVTMAELATADIEWFTDSARNDPLGTNEAADYLHEIRDIDLDANTFTLWIDLSALAALPSDTELYPQLVVEQG